MTNDTLDIILDLCEFGPPKRIVVGGTPKLLRKCNSVPKDFWNLWREHKEEIKELGFSVGRNDDDEFEVKWWSDEKEVAEDEAIPPSRPVLELFAPLKTAADKLRDYQIPAAATLIAAIRQHKFGLDASETGFGKTYTAGGVAANLGLNVAVICPANVVTKWEDTLTEVFGVDPEFVMSYEKLRAGKTEFISRADRTIRKRTTTTFTWNVVDDVLLIFDEIHLCKNSSSLNARMLRAAVINPKIRVLGLSATAVLSILNLDELGLALRLHNGNHWDWALKNGARPGVFGGLTFSSNPGSQGEKTLKRLHSVIFPERGCRLGLKDYPDALPPNEILVQIVDAPEAVPAWMKLAMEAVDQSEVEDQMKADEKEMDVSAFTELLRQRQRTELLKLPFIIDRVVDDVESGKSPIVFLNYTPSIDAFMSQMPKDLRYRKMVGGLSKKDRDQRVADFQSNKAQLFVAQLQAGSASIDLHDLQGDHPRVTYICPNYDAIKLIQALGRAPRNGGKSNVLQNIVFLSTKIEKHLAKNVQAKLNNISLINDGDLTDVVQVKE
jgi:hypothetical protein